MNTQPQVVNRFLTSCLLGLGRSSSFGLFIYKNTLSWIPKNKFFKEYEITYVPHKENTCADVLSLLANTGSPIINHSFVQDTKRKHRVLD